MRLPLGHPFLAIAVPSPTIPRRHLTLKKPKHTNPEPLTSKPNTLGYPTAPLKNHTDPNHKPRMVTTTPRTPRLSPFDTNIIIQKSYTYEPLYTPPSTTIITAKKP